MAGFAAPIASIAGSIFNGIYGGNRYRRVGENIANVQEGTAQNIINSTGAGQGMVAQAGNDAMTQVNNATTNANNILQGGMDQQTNNLNPYLQTGAAGANALQQFATHAPSFTYQDYANDPAFAFQMQQGNQAINNSAAARGGAVGGNVLKDLTTFGQGLASTYYNDAFDRYMRGRDSQLNALTAATNTGLTASSQFNSAVQNGTNQQAGNVLAAGRYGGDTNLNVAQFLANFGRSGEQAAGDYHIAGAQSRGAGLLGQANAVTGMVNQGTNALSSPVTLGSSGSGGTTNILSQLASIFGGH